MKTGIDMKYNYLLLALATIALFSCSRKEIDNPELDGQAITIRAYQEGATGTRTTLVDGGTQVYWELSDEIKVFFNGSGGRFTSQNTENATVATFSGIINVVAGANEGTNSSLMTWGVYPYRSDATSDGKSVTTTLPGEQTGRAGSFAKNTHITLAQSEGLNLAFYNVTGGIRFSLTQEGVKEVVFEGQNNETIAGKVKIAFADGVPAIQEVLEGQKTITLTAPNGGTFETGKRYYIVAFPGTLSNGFKMTFNTATQYATLKSSGSKTIKRGIFGSLADADEDLIYKDMGGGEPPVTGNIEFADLAAKYACVAKFDTNGDGEVSIEEAEAATTLSGVFTDWKTVASFDEIRYFKNVHSLNEVFKGCNKLVSITVPENITDLGTNAFNGCSSLTSVVLPSGITAIGKATFAGCSLLGSIIIPLNVTSIGQYAFSGCTVLGDIDLPSGVKTLGDYAFQNCQSFKAVDFPASLTSIGSYGFSGCTSLTSVVLPNRVSVGQYAFSECTSLASIVLPEDMTSIPKGCFKSCVHLVAITWPSVLTTIGDYAFDYCRFMDSNYTLQLPSSVTNIGNFAFGYLRHLIMPSTSPISIASYSFSSNYTILYVPANMVEIYKIRTYWSDYSGQIRPIADYPELQSVGGAVGRAVDLGLSVKWATWNVGASSSEEYGDYFAWGETELDAYQSWVTYKWCTGTTYSTTSNPTEITKYNTNGLYGVVDNKTRLDLEDDAARANWGGKWRIPTDAEWTELIDNCTRTWTAQNGVNGWLLSSKKNGASIFLPASGSQTGYSSAGSGSSGYYWSSSLSDSPTDALSLYFASNVFYMRKEDRYRGHSIRPVCD